MGYKVLSASKYTSRLKATIHASGKLGFSEATARELGLKDNSENYIQFAQDDENPDLLYLINNTMDDGDSFKVCKAGAYYYVNTKVMFDSLGIDYISKTIIFDIIKLQDTVNEVYKMIKRELERTKTTRNKKTGRRIADCRHPVQETKLHFLRRYNFFSNIGGKSSRK